MRWILNKSHTSLLILMDLGRQFPIISTFSCLNGYFDSPRFPTIAERFLNERDKAAIASTSNTRDSTAMENLFLNICLYDSIFNLDIYQLGPILIRSKIRSIKDVNHFANFINTFSSFGDPTLKIDLENSS